MGGTSVFDDVTLHYVDDSAEAAEFVEWIKRPRYTVAIDTETTGLARDARIRLIQFGDETAAWTLRWDRWKGAAIEALEILKSARQRITFHNAPYDVPKIERQSALDGMLSGRHDGHKFDWGLVDDTMILSRLASPLGSHSLKALTTKLVDPRARLMQNVLSDAMAENGWTWETVPYSYEGYGLYAGSDCVLTAMLLPKLEAMNYDRDLYATEMTCSEACIAMSEAGMAVDLWYCKEQIELLEQELEDLGQQGRDNHRFWQYGSNQMLVDKLHYYGVYWEERTPAGKVSVEGDVLERIAAEHEGSPGGDLARLALAHRQRTKLLSTYFRNFLLEAGEGDGSVHPDINTLEAVTGRMSVTKPAMQTLPRGPRARRAFVAKDGHYLVMADYAQIEMRLLAHFCKDPALMQAVEQEDLHTAVAEMVFSGAADSKALASRVARQGLTGAAALRQLAKTSGFAVIYGAGPAQFSHTAGVTIEEGTAFLEAYHARFPMVKPFIQQVQTVARAREREGLGAHVTTPAGRRLQMRKTDAHYTLVNYLIQGSAADVFKRAIERMWTSDLGQHMRLPVHDECIFEVPSDVDPEEFKREAVKAMEDDTFDVPMAVEASGPYQNWADKYGAPPEN